MSVWAMKRISNLKFIVKNIPMSPSPSVTKKNKPSQCLPQMISSTSGDCSKHPLAGLEEKKKNHHHQVLEIEKEKEGCRRLRLRPQVKYSTWDEILRKTKRIDYVEDGEVDDMMISPSLLNSQHVMRPDRESSHSAVFRGSSSSVLKTGSSSSVFKGSSAVKGSSSVFKGSSSPVFNLKGEPPLMKNASDNNAKTEMHHGDDDAGDDPSARNASTSKAKKTVNVVPRRSATGHHQADVPLLVRRKSKQQDSDSRHMQSKATKALIFPSKRPRNQHDDDDNNGTSALNFKRRRTTLTSSGVKPKPAESPQTSANSCQTVVSNCCISKKAIDSVKDSSDASSVMNILPADKQPKAVFKNAAAHSNTIRASPQDDDCDIPSIIDEDSYNKAKRRVEILTKYQQVILRTIADPLQKEAKRQQMTRKVKIIEGKMRAFEKTMAAHISLEKVDKYNEDRRAARIALEKVVKTVEFNDTNNGCMEELDRLINVRLFDLNFVPSDVPKPLEQFGLYP